MKTKKKLLSPRAAEKSPEAVDKSVEKAKPSQASSAGSKPANPIKKPKDSADKSQKPLSKKARQKLAFTPGKTMINELSRVMKSSVSVARQLTGSASAVIGSESDQMIIGIPLPSLSMEYLIQNNCWPLERFAQVVGREGSFKSSFTMEVLRWFQESYGVGVLLENESKFSPDGAAAVIGDGMQRLSLIRCKNQEEWQQHMQHQVKHFQTIQDGTKSEPGPGRVFPVLMILDSLAGQLSLDTIEEIEKKGFADRGFAIEAMKNTKFIPTVISSFQAWPFSLLITNHLKKGLGQSAPGVQERQKPGGVLTSFAETFELQMNRGAKFHIETAKYDGVHVELRCFKNSLGTTNRRIAVDIHWWDEKDPETGVRRQVTKFRWHAATVRLLLNLTSGDKKSKVNEVLTLKKGNGETVSCRQLGLRNPVPFEEAGELIAADPKIMEYLRDIFAIKMRRLFVPGVPYTKQREAVEREARSKGLII